MRSLPLVGCAVAVSLTLASSPSLARPPEELAIQRSVAGCPAFPQNNYWHADIRNLPRHPRSANWLKHMSPGTRLHPDFGRSYGEQPVPYGIPITVVGDSHHRVNVKFRYASESDRRRYPLGNDTRIEGGWRASGDRHAIVIDGGDCTLFETWRTKRRDGSWHAGSGAVWDLRSNALRPDGWTSADAAGLPILPGLLRWSEVRTDTVDHAIRFTTDVTDTRHVWPARHDAGSVNNHNYPPMGARFRLKEGYDVSKFSRRTTIVLKAMQTFGLVLADNGSPWYFQGDATSKWPSHLLDQLKRVPASAFVAVDASSLKVKPNSGRVSSP